MIALLLPRTASASRPDVLVAPFVPGGTAAVGEAGALSAAVEGAIRQAPALTVLSAAAAPAVDQMTASIYLNSCPVDDYQECALVVARNAGVPWVVAGRVTARDGDPGPPTFEVEIAFIEVRSGQSEEMVSTFGPKADVGWTQDVVEHLRGLVGGDIVLEQGDIRRTAVEPEEAPKELPDRAPPARGDMRPSEDDDTLPGALREEPYDPASRASDLVVELGAGGAWGPTAVVYTGELVVDDATSSTAALRGSAEASMGMSTSGALGVGVGLGERVDVMLRGRLLRGTFGTSVERSVEGGEAEWDIAEPTGLLGWAAEGALHVRLRSTRRLAPFVEAGAGVAAIPLTLARQADLPRPCLGFPAFGGPAPSLLPALNSAWAPTQMSL